MSSDRGSRKRRSSSIVYHEPPESIEQLSDQSALPNLNAEWVNAKGTVDTMMNTNLRALEEGQGQSRANWCNELVTNKCNIRLPDLSSTILHTSSSLTP